MPPYYKEDGCTDVLSFDELYQLKKVKSILIIDSATINSLNKCLFLLPEDSEVTVVCPLTVIMHKYIHLLFTQLSDVCDTNCSVGKLFFNPFSADHLFSLCCFTVTSM